MPSFFPSLHRSRTQGRSDRARYDNPIDYDSRQSQSSAWSRVVPPRRGEEGHVRLILSITRPVLIKTKFAVAGRVRRLS